MKCKITSCEGKIENGVCQLCGARQEDAEEKRAKSRQATITSVHRLLQAKEISPSREDLAEAAQALQTVVPYNYDAWRLHADLLLNALHQLETREIQPDASFTLLAIPLRQDDLKDAAEKALRQCAHFAQSDEMRIAIIDEANRIRRTTWF